MTQLNFSDDFCRHILHLVHGAVIITDSEGTVLAANPGVREVFGYTAEGLKGKKISILFTPEDQKYLYPNYLYLAEQCRIHQDEIMLLRRNKARFYAGIKLCGLREQGQALNVFSIMDIDKTKKIEKVFHQISYNDLLKLANGMAHEIRNPLMGIGGLLRKLYKSCAATVEDEEYYKYINNNLRKIEAIVEKVEFFASMPEPVLDQTSLKEVVEGVVSEYADSMQSGECFIDLDISQVVIVADKTLLKRAVGILLSNSLDACSQNPGIVIRAYADNNFCRIMVKDNGKGIPSEQLPYIFHPFYSTKPDGAGIDLAILKRIIDNHNGSINVESQKGKGTTFTIDIPLERRKRIRTNLLRNSEQPSRE